MSHLLWLNNIIIKYAITTAMYFITHVPSVMAINSLKKEHEHGFMLLKLYGLENTLQIYNIFLY